MAKEPSESQDRPGAAFLRAHGALRGKIRIGPDFEFTEDELDELPGG